MTFSRGESHLIDGSNKTAVVACLQRDRGISGVKGGPLVY